MRDDARCSPRPRLPQVSGRARAIKLGLDVGAQRVPDDVTELRALVAEGAIVGTPSQARRRRFRCASLLPEGALMPPPPPALFRY